MRDLQPLLIVGATILGLATPSLAIPRPPKLPGRFELVVDGDRHPARLTLTTATAFRLRVGGQVFALTRASSEATVFEGPALAGGGMAQALAPQGATLELKYKTLNLWVGTLTTGAEETPVELQRDVRLAEAGATFDAGPSEPFASHLAAAPGYPHTGEYEGIYWDDWGPVFHRGRLDGSARVLGIASDPGPTECLPFVRRSLVGDAGQRVQGLLDKLGVTQSYLLLNAFTYATRPSKTYKSFKLLRDDPVQRAWRRTLYDLAYDENELEAIVLFGDQAVTAFEQWNASRIDRGLGDVRDRVAVVECYHPSAGKGAWNSAKNLELADTWRAAVEALRQVVTPDDPDLAQLPTYGEVFSEADYGVVPQADLPAGALAYPWLRDMSYARNRTKGRHSNPVKRIGRLTLELRPPEGERTYLTVTFRDPDQPNALPEYAVSEVPPPPEVDPATEPANLPLGD